MSRRSKYRLDRVLVEPGEARAATWTFGGATERGTEQSYRVTDTNFASRRFMAEAALPLVSRVGLECEEGFIDLNGTRAAIGLRSW